MKLKNILLAGMIGVLFVSCATETKDESGDKSTDDATYAVYKNFGAMPARAALPDGEAVVGVLLKHSSEGAYNATVASIDPETFSIWCLFDDHGTNGDGMEFNYVLYVPEDVFETYRNANGKNPDSGNAFWWYMSTYYHLSMSAIQHDWPTIITTLCAEEECPKADAKDIGTWVAN